MAVAVAVVVAVMVIIIRVAVVMVVAVITAVAVMAPGKGSGENPEKSSLRREGKLSSRLPMRNGTCLGVIGTPINVSPA